MFLGKSIKMITPTELNVIDSKLNRIGMGYVGLSKMTPFDPISWVEEEHEYTHPFSLQRRFYDYGYFRLKEIFTLNEYLNMEAYLLDKAMKYIRLGADSRLKDEIRANKDKGEPEMSEVEKVMKNLLGKG